MKDFEILCLGVLLLIGSCMMSGCTPLNQGDSRKITAWGIWCTAAACGVGYWHSERGPGENIQSEQSAKPEATELLLHH